MLRLGFLFCCCALLTAETVSTMSEGCRLDRFTVHSTVMNRDIEAIVVVPPAYLTDEKASFPILYALHGRGAAYTVWSDMMPLKRSLAEHPMMVASFSADKASWYLDATEQPDSQFTTFFHDEFIPAIDAAYRIDTTRRAITGFSMGAFGAMHFALTFPDTFVAVSGLSGALNPLGENGREPGKDVVNLLGDRATHAEHYAELGVYRRSKEQAANLPPLYLHCGTEDRYVEEQRTYAEHLKQAGVSEDRFTILESSGKHDWAFWRDASAGIIAFHAQHFTTAAAK